MSSLLPRQEYYQSYLAPLLLPLLISLIQSLLQFDSPLIQATMKEVTSYFHSLLLLSSSPQVQEAIVQKHPSLQPHCDNAPPHKAHTTLLLVNIRVGCTQLDQSQRQYTVTSLCPSPNCSYTVQEHEMEQARNIIAQTLKNKILPKLPEYKFTVMLR